jgi:hypothetical protein
VITAVEFLGILGVSVAASVLVKWIRHRHTSGLEIRLQVECGLRVVSGHHDKLRGDWQWGRATVIRGQISFTVLVGGLPFVKRGPVPIHVKAIHPNQQRALLPWGTGSSDRNFIITPLTVPGAKLDWAVPNDRVDWAVGEL